VSIVCALGRRGTKLTIGKKFLVKLSVAVLFEMIYKNRLLIVMSVVFNNASVTLSYHNLVIEPYQNALFCEEVLAYVLPL